MISTNEKRVSLLHDAQVRIERSFRRKLCHPNLVSVSIALLSDAEID